MSVLTLTDVHVTCPVCHVTMPLSQLNGHETHHKALKVLKFKDAGGPVSSEVLLKRRRLIVKKLVYKYKEQPDKSGLLQKLDKLDESSNVVQSNLYRGQSLYNTLVHHIDRPTMKEGSLRVETEDLINDIRSNGVYEGLPDCITAVGTCETMNIEHRNVMEDRTLINTGFLPLDDHSSPSCYLGMYDGHHGQAAVNHTNQYLHTFIEKEVENVRTPDYLTDNDNLNHDEILQELNHVIISSQCAGDAETKQDTKEDTNLLQTAQVLQCMAKSYKKMDEYLQHGIDEKSRIRWSGCSATSLLITDEQTTTPIDGSGDATDTTCSKCAKIFVANAGNVEAYIFHNNKAFPLTTLHTPNLQTEKDRVLSVGGKIIQNNRHPCVNGILQTTRGLGNHGDPELRASVISHPSTASCVINDNSQFIVMATSSLWKLLDIRNVTKIIRSTFLSSTSDEHPVPIRMVYKHSKHGSSEEERSGGESESEDALERKLTSIVETDEDNCDEIEEVIIVQGSEDDDVSTQLSVRDEHTTVEKLSTIGSEHESEDYSQQSHPNVNEESARIAQLISERLVRAALTAGAVDNVSVVVVLLRKDFT
ncbi:protein phosphatase 2C-like domain-containing protein 1 [Ciona intestinalis]